ncbi:hypothetical protein BDR26DRAFT_522619 [Obelidium mucronatum]|nr:hypothetical protein BDR26DRAFT_522619 [Obelidium mucronatum]
MTKMYPSIRMLGYSSAIAASFFFVGDASAQVLSGTISVPSQFNPSTWNFPNRTQTFSMELRRAVQTWDYERTLKMTAFGAGFHGFFFLSSFRFLDKRIGYNRVFHVAATKAVLNQIVFAPIYLSAFLYYQSTFVTSYAGVNTGSPTEFVSQNFLGLYSKAWLYWPIVNCISFRFVPAGVPRLVFLAPFWAAWIARIGTQPSTESSSSLEFGRLDIQSL